MDSYKEEKKLLRFSYLLCIICFLNLAVKGEVIDRSALIMGFIICMLMSYSHFIIRRFFPDGDKYILIFSNVLALLGIVMLFRLDKVENINQLFSIKQTMWFTVGIGCFILIVVLLPDLKSFKKFKYIYMILTLIFMSMGTFLGKEIYGAKNWIIINGISFQPSEFGKLSLVAYLAAALEGYGKTKKEKGFSVIDKMIDSIFSKYDINESFKSLIEPAIVVMVSLGFMVLQRDLGSALILFGISVTMLYIATSKLKYILTCIGLFLFGSLISYKLFYHVRKRIIIWLDPWKYANNEAYQIIQSLIAIGSGGLFGSGLGLGHPDVIPVVTTDFIFAAICEEMGLLTGFAIIILYFLLFYRCMRAAIYVEDNFSRLVAVGYSTMIATQALVIIGGVLGVIPLTGITLPLVSYGGSSMVITFFALGIVQKISEEGRQ
jgi:cell division protein FtsW (lipid II flippase)